MGHKLSAGLLSALISDQSSDVQCGQSGTGGTSSSVHVANLLPRAHVNDITGIPPLCREE